MRFVDALCNDLGQLDKALLTFLSELVGQTATQREMQQRHDTWLRYQKVARSWLTQTAGAWREALDAPASSAAVDLPSNTDPAALELLGDDAVENKLAASRMALIVTEQVASIYDLVRRRTQYLEDAELDSADVLRPETLCLKLVEQWLDAGLEREDLQLAVDPLQRTLATLLLPLYRDVAALYDEQGVASPEQLQSMARVRHSDFGVPPTTGTGSMTGPGSGIDMHSSLRARLAGQAMAGAQGMHHTMPGMPVVPGSSGQPAYINPFVRARQRAQGVMMQLRRLLAQPATGFDMEHAPPASAALTEALTAYQAVAPSHYDMLATQILAAPPQQAVVQMVAQVASEAQALKKKAGSASEKAIIEVVALMFQSILSEERIPAAVRVWFARLQVPVLRVALADPSFFRDLAHPARKLIDRMGACVLGFDAGVSVGALEVEIRRIVQVIEQYPETGKRVFQLVYDEFEKFLARYLTEDQTKSRLVGLAQQVEHKETLAIQYTIELRTMLQSMPVREEIREFLFKTWAEVLAMSAVRYGPQNAQTLAFKRLAADLVWACSAKPHRSDRARVVERLPGLLECLSAGLALLGMQAQAQQTQIKQLTDIMSEAFVARTDGIAQEQIEAMAERLAELEDYIDDDALGDMPLNADNIEMLLGIDASSIQVIADVQGSPPPLDDMLQWARNLQPGSWFTLEHNGVQARVQYIWHSDRKQLHLFAAGSGNTYLMQLARMAAYLQSGLLAPQEQETLTLRATREALTKLDANPERLLA
ncbi:hypothetical protein GCM10022279_08970 [Comamonas faecalis]|uniref:DUF1631 domain-containing protein n=2 Tax=Comamonas faecalis TaxID=1387849 RepID=A0ABP7QU18_9BURK